MREEAEFTRGKMSMLSVFLAPLKGDDATFAYGSYVHRFTIANLLL